MVEDATESVYSLGVGMILLLAFRYLALWAILLAIFLVTSV